MEQKTKKQNKRHGAAMFLVIASVFIFTMLAFLGLQLSNRDNLLTGDLLEIKSQRLAAIAGLNLALTQFALDPTKTVEYIQKYQADNELKWINLANAKYLELSNSQPDWFFLQDADLKGIATKVEILGVGSQVVDGYLPLVLHAYGKGRNGEIFEVQGTYGIRGLSTPSTNLTNGPDQAFLARGGFTYVNSGIKSDAGVYIGGKSGSDMTIQNPSVFDIRKLKVNGDLIINSSVRFSSNAYVNGSLMTNGNCNALFEDDVVINGGLSSTLNGVINAKKSFYLFGPATNTDAHAANVTVDGNFWVRDFVWRNNKKLLVGTSLNNSIVRLDKGINLTDKPESDVEIYGSVDVGGENVSRIFSNNKFFVSGDLNFYNNGVTISGPVNISIGGSLYANGSLTASNPKNMISQDLFVNSNLSLSNVNQFSVAGSVSVVKNLVTDKSNIDFYGTSSVNQSSIVTNNSVLRFRGDSWFGNVVDNAKSDIIIDGNSILEKGVIGADDNDFSFKFNGNSWWNSVGQKRWLRGSVTIQKDLSLNGSLDEYFPSSTARSQWSFSGNGKFNAQTSLSALSFSNAFNPLKPPSMIIPRIGGQTKNEFFGTPLTFPVYKAKDVAFLDDSKEALIKMGFDQDQLETDPAKNPASIVNTSLFSKELFAKSHWASIYATYRTQIPLHRSSEASTPPQCDAPTGEQLKNLYKYVSGPNGDPSLMYGEFMVITLENEQDYLHFMSIKSSKIPSGVKIFWNIIGSGAWKINGNWYSSDEGTYQVLYTTQEMTEFGWNGNFYGFIYMAGATPGTMKSSSVASLYGAWEIQNPNALYSNGPGGSGFEFWRKKDQSIKALNVIKESFSLLTLEQKRKLESITNLDERAKADPRVIIFNGDNDLSNIKYDVQMKATQGWIQVDRIGEYR